MLRRCAALIASCDGERAEGAMTEYEYCQLFEGEEGELHIGYFDRNPAGSFTFTGRDHIRFSWANAPAQKFVEGHGRVHTLFHI
jgi:hypothetical protein